MTSEEIETTLYNLNYVIEEKRNLVLCDDKIRVRIGRELLAWINGYARGLILNSCSTIHKTIWGYQIEIDYNYPMCLDVLIVESVPVYKEGDAVYDD